MIFNTYWFVLFTVVFFPGYWLIRWPAARGWWLLCGCAVFHTHFAGPAGVVPIIVLGALTYACALSGNRLLCYGAVAACVIALVGYKYTHFLSAEILAAIAPELGAKTNAIAATWLPAIPPLALSFFTFEFVHYLIDVARGHAPIRSPKDFTLFAIYFPSLVAGPIKRFQDFTAPEAWLFLAALAARILLDFSGYTDIALGFSQMLGVRLPENFNYPYAATGLRDFWARWHISLSSWIRDYIYIPLGGSRHGRVRLRFQDRAAPESATAATEETMASKPHPSNAGYGKVPMTPCV